MSMPIYTSNSTNSLLSSSSVTWSGNPTLNAIGGMPSGTYTIGTGGLPTTLPFNTTSVIVNIKRCRNCNHAHLAEQTGCIDQEGWNTVFVICNCKEYLPKDNLEYLEYLSKKKDK